MRNQTFGSNDRNSNNIRMNKPQPYIKFKHLEKQRFTYKTTRVHVRKDFSAAQAEKDVEILHSHFKMLRYLHKRRIAKVLLHP